MILTLCGSARFEPWFHIWNEILTLSGHTVFGLAVYPSVKGGEKNWYTDAEKARLDRAHLDKIRNSNGVLILNPFAYIGESTLNEIAFAREQGKLLYALESWGKGNGIGRNHFQSVQEAAKKYGVYTGSPIDTFHPHFAGPWDLLPEAGRFRSKLVDRLNAFRAEYEGKGDE